ncbi:MAG: flagellar protein FlaG [Peptococcaceae bacterium]|nr:flagellar protein FlaG [Peptococcaceae bacterium]
MEIRPIKSITSSAPILAAAGSEGQKFARTAEIAHLAVSRRQGAVSHEETPRDALKKAEQDKEVIGNAAESLNKLMGLIDKKIEFAVHDKTQRIMIKVLNSESGDVLSEFPSEKILDFYASLVEAIGIAVDERI